MHVAGLWLAARKPWTVALIRLHQQQALVWHGSKSWPSTHKLCLTCAAHAGAGRHAAQVPGGALRAARPQAPPGRAGHQRPALPARCVCCVWRAGGRGTWDNKAVLLENIGCTQQQCPSKSTAFLSHVLPGTEPLVPVHPPPLSRCFAHSMPACAHGTHPRTWPQARAALSSRPRQPCGTSTSRTKSPTRRSAAAQCRAAAVAAAAAPAPAHHNVLLATNKEGQLGARFWPAHPPPLPAHRPSCTHPLPVPCPGCRSWSPTLPCCLRAWPWPMGSASSCCGSTQRSVLVFMVLMATHPCERPQQWAPSTACLPAQRRGC